MAFAETTVDISTLHTHPANGKIYDVRDDDDAELIESIRTYGIMNPLIVNHKFFIISGNRRYRAAIKVGIDKIPIVTRHFKSPDEEIEFLILANQNRVKTNEEKIREGKKLTEIMARKSPGGRISDAAGKKVGLSGKTLKKGEKVIEEIDALKKTNPLKAEKLRGILDKSVDAASKAVDEQITEDELNAEMDDMSKDIEAKLKEANEKRTLFYLAPLKDLLKHMQRTYQTLAAKRGATTPDSLGHFIGNICEMTERLSSWLPENMIECPKCLGTGKIKTLNANKEQTEVVCGVCINGRSGLYKKSEH